MTEEFIIKPQQAALANTVQQSPRIMKLRWRMNLNGDIQIEDVIEEAPLLTLKMHNDLAERLNPKTAEDFANDLLDIVVKALNRA